MLIRGPIELAVCIYMHIVCNSVCVLCPQHRQLEIVLSGFSSRGDFVGLFAGEVLAARQDACTEFDLTHVNKLFDLIHRMVQYLHTATVRERDVITI